ncbi:hypothetical protein CRG98_038765 [Punica granatum]|uniref:Uncharacterized protein n=1 Tax=Punica granatum TaxID=22663 RepID=A0A2I0IA26_PUNGR|nr:hypothetical protein CRG98_038765 [Punica granatum]
MEPRGLFRWLLGCRRWCGYTGCSKGFPAYNKVKERGRKGIAPAGVGKHRLNRSKDVSKEQYKVSQQHGNKTSNHTTVESIDYHNTQKHYE